MYCVRLREALSRLTGAMPFRVHLLSHSLDRFSLYLPVSMSFRAAFIPPAEPDCPTRAPPARQGRFEVAAVLPADGSMRSLFSWWCPVVPDHLSELTQFVPAKIPSKLRGYLSPAQGNPVHTESSLSFRTLSVSKDQFASLCASREDHSPPHLMLLTQACAVYCCSLGRSMQNEGFKGVAMTAIIL